jgi:hypothetical protein
MRRLLALTIFSLCAVGLTSANGQEMSVAGVALAPTFSGTTGQKRVEQTRAEPTRTGQLAHIVPVSDRVQTDVTRGTDERRAELLAIFEAVCKGNLGDAEAIHTRAATYTDEIPFLGQTTVRGLPVNAMFYPLMMDEAQKSWGDGRAWIINAGGLVCGIASDRALRFPQFLRSNRDVAMDRQVIDQFRDDDVPLTYGVLGQGAHAIRQYSLRIIRSSERIDFIEMVAPAVLASDQKTTIEITGTFDPDAALESPGNDKLLLATVEQVCAQHLGDFDAMLDAAHTVVGTGSLSRIFSSFSPYGQKVRKFVLKRNSTRNIAMLTLGEDGDMCGYWEVGRGFDGLDLFAQFDITPIHQSGDARYFEHVGYASDVDAAVIEQVLPAGNDVMRGVMYFQQAAYDRIPREYDLVSPWAF